MANPSKIKKIIKISIITSLGLLSTAAATIVILGLRDNIGHADVALVLGSKVELNGVPSRRLAARLDRTSELYKAGYFKTIITSGGLGVEGFDEAKVMQQYLVTRGVPTEHIVIDSNGNTTYASAKFTAAFMQQRKLTKVFVISQYFHLPRARLALERFRVPGVYSSYARFFEGWDVYSSFRETAGYIQYYFRRY